MDGTKQEKPSAWKATPKQNLSKFTSTGGVVPPTPLTVEPDDSQEQPVSSDPVQDPPQPVAKSDEPKGSTQQPADPPNPLGDTPAPVTVPAPSPAPEPMPAPEPTPGPVPSLEATPAPEPTPTPGPTPGPAPDPTPAPGPAPSPETTLVPTPAPGPTPTPTPGPQPTTTPGPASTPGTPSVVLTFAWAPKLFTKPIDLVFSYQGLQNPTAERLQRWKTVAIKPDPNMPFMMEPILCVDSYVFSVTPSGSGGTPSLPVFSLPCPRKCMVNLIMDQGKLTFTPPVPNPIVGQNVPGFAVKNLSGDMQTISIGHPPGLTSLFQPCLTWKGVKNNDDRDAPDFNMLYAYISFTGKKFSVEKKDWVPSIGMRDVWMQSLDQLSPSFNGWLVTPTEDGLKVTESDEVALNKLKPEPEPSDPKQPKNGKK